MHLQSHWAPGAFTGMRPLTIPLSRCPPQPFPLIPGVYTIYLYISYKRQHGSACVLARPSAGFNPPEFWSSCGLAVSCCLATSSVRSRGLLSPRIFMVLGGMKAAFVPFTSRDLGVRGALIVLMGILCVVGLNSDLYHLCGSLYALDTCWARKLS